MKTISLTKQRKKIDKIDSILVNLLDERANVVKTIGKIKKTGNFPILDKSREKIVLEKTKLAKNHIFVRNTFQKMLEFSKNLQEEII